MPLYRPYFPELIRLHGRWLAAKPALMTGAGVVSWEELDQQTNQVANGLLAAGCGHSARIGILMDNSAGMVTVMLGALKAGAVVVPLNTSISDEAVNDLLEDADVSAVFASSTHVARISQAVRGRCNLTVADHEIAKDASWSALPAWCGAYSTDAPNVSVKGEDICNIIYSSGTTGLPKGIVHTHAIRCDWAHDLAHALRYDSGARTLIATGLYSNISWVSLLCTVLVGGTLVVVDRFDPEATLATIERERTTHTSMVPVQYQRLLEHPDFSARDTSSMRAMMCCGSPLPERVKAELLKHYPGALIELYGSTEGVVTTLAPEDAEGRIASVGKPLPGGDLQILGAGDLPVPTGEQGEIVMLSRFAMAGYWKNESATADAMLIDDRGQAWLRTGDIGRVDEHGFLYITDRKKDVILSGGQNIYPADLEAVLARNPYVQECAVIGVPSDRWGESPLALVVPTSGAVISEAELLEWANMQLGRQQRLSQIEFRETLARNANGKLLKRELRASYWSTVESGGRGT